MIFISTDRVVVGIRTKRDCQCHRYLFVNEKVIFLREGDCFPFNFLSCERQMTLEKGEVNQSSNA